MPGRLGRRGGFLLAFAIAWCCIGFGLLTAPPQVPPATLLHVCLHVWGGVWLACGIIALAAAFLPHTGRIDVVGFIALMLPDAVWLGGGVTRWLLDMDSRAWVQAVVWAAVFAALVVVAGWREPASLHSIAAGSRLHDGEH